MRARVVGEPPMTGTATLSVTLLDINDHAPDFDDGEEEFVIPANAQSGAEIARIYGFDLDSVENGPPFTFEWLCNEQWCSDFQLATETDGKHKITVHVHTVLRLCACET